MAFTCAEAACCHVSRGCLSVRGFLLSWLTPELTAPGGFEVESACGYVPGGAFAIRLAAFHVLKQFSSSGCFS